MATCRKCGKNPAKDNVCLTRVNEIGVLPAIWECRPSCDAKLSAGECVLLAIEGDSKNQVVMLPSDIVDVMINGRNAQIDLLRTALSDLVQAHQRARKADDDFNRAEFLVDDEDGSEEEWKQIQEEFEAAHVDLVRVENAARKALKDTDV